MAQKKYASLSTLQTFLDNLKSKFANISHKHTISDISDYTVDTSLSSTSANPVQNKVIDAEFDAISDAMGALEVAIDGKSDSGHTHTIADVTSLQTTLDAKVPTSRTVNGKALSTNITLSASDVGADASGSANAVQENLDAHASNTDIHFTVAERTKLSGIAEGAQVNTVIGVKGNSEASYRTGNINITKANIGLDSVDNTSDANKPVSSAQQSAIDASLVSANEYTDTAISNLINGAPTTLDTLGEIATAMEENENVVEALNAAIGTKANASDLTSHTNNKSNPHGVTLAQLGVTATAEELNIMDGVTTTAAEINKLDGLTATTTELNYINGVTSSVQTQLDAKQNTITGAASTIASSNLTENRALASDESGKVVVSDITSTELGYLSGVTSNIQNQIDQNAGTKVEGQVFTVNEADATAEIGAEIFNDYTNNVAIGAYSHAEGELTNATGYASHTEGYGTIASGYISHAEGCATTAMGYASHTEGFQTAATGESSHAEGQSSTIVPDTITPDSSINDIEASWDSTKFTLARSIGSHAEGSNTLALGVAAHSEGYQTIAEGAYSHAQGYGTKATGSRTHAEGQGTVASGNDSHAEGTSTTASGESSHTEGNHTTASGACSHAEGTYTVASGANSHAEGYYTNATKAYAHAEGRNTIASSQIQHVQGKYNIEDANSTYAHIVGNGTSDTARSNAHTLDWNGNAWFKGSVYVGGTGQNDESALRVITEEDIIPLEKGGTGATTAAGALTNLGITATAAELNKMDGVTATTTELNYVDGVTSNIQTQLNGKAASSHNHSASNITSGTLPITRGGTGATTAADARSNLGITPTNIGALPLSGGTMTGKITIGQEDGYGIELGENGHINYGTGTMLGMANGDKLLVGHASVCVNLRGNSIVLTTSTYGTSLPSAGTAGRIFFKKV